MMHSGKEARVYCFCPSGDSESKLQRALPATRPRTSAFEVTTGIGVWGWAWNDGKSLLRRGGARRKASKGLLRTPLSSRTRRPAERIPLNFTIDDLEVAPVAIDAG